MSVEASMHAFWKALIILGLASLYSGCDRMLELNGYSILKMNGEEYRISSPSNGVLPTNVKSFAVVDSRFLVGEGRVHRSDVEMRSESKEGWFFIDTKERSEFLGLSRGEFEFFLQDRKLAEPRRYKETGIF